MVGVMETSFKRIYANNSQDSCSLYPKTHGRPLSTHSSDRDSHAHIGKFGQALVDGEGQGGLVYCSPWGHKESDMAERLNNSNVNFTIK